MKKGENPEDANNQEESKTENAEPSETGSTQKSTVSKKSIQTVASDIDNMPLSFRDRLLKSSPLAKQFLNNLQQKEEEERIKEEKIRHKNRNLSQRLSYLPSA